MPIKWEEIVKLMSNYLQYLQELADVWAQMMFPFFLSCLSLRQCDSLCDLKENYERKEEKKNLIGDSFFPPLLAA